MSYQRKKVFNTHVKWLVSLNLFYKLICPGTSSKALAVLAGACYGRNMVSHTWIKEVEKRLPWRRLFCNGLLFGFSVCIFGAYGISYCWRVVASHSWAFPKLVFVLLSCLDSAFGYYAKFLFCKMHNKIGNFKSLKF